ncbi:MAG: alpha/beta hydrolase family protein [Planctomycetaceae bacterium]
MLWSFQSRVCHLLPGLATCVLWLSATQLTAQETPVAAPVRSHGEREGTWNGFRRLDFELGGHPVLIVIPQTPAEGRPWVWHGEFFGHRPIPDVALLGRGFHVVYTRFSDQFGGPPVVQHWNAVYQAVTERYGLGPRPALVGTSRGGLYCYNWAAANPDRVSCIFGDAPVCDLKSWPMGRGSGRRSDGEVAKLLAVYNVASEDELLQRANNPVDHLQPLAKAGVPILHVSGDADEIVPLSENTGLVQDRYRKLGGSMQVIIKPGVGHVHGLDDSTPIIEFIDEHARKGSPQTESSSTPGVQP